MLVVEFYKLPMDLVTLTEVCLQCVCVCVCVVLCLMPQVVLDIFALWLIYYRPVGPRKEQTQHLKISHIIPPVDWSPV